MEGKWNQQKQIVVNSIESKFRWYLERCGFSSFFARGTHLMVHVRVSYHEVVIARNFFWKLSTNTEQCAFFLQHIIRKFAVRNQA